MLQMDIPESIRKACKPSSCVEGSEILVYMGRSGKPLFTYCKYKVDGVMCSKNGTKRICRQYDNTHTL
jgi:hypothetical protein